MSSQEQKPPIDINVTVDPKNMEALLKRIEEEQQKRKEAEGKLEEKITELEDLKSKTTIIAEKMFQRRKESVGCYDETIDSPEKLEIWERAKGRPVKPEPSGTVPLSDAQRGISSQGYDSYEDMIQDLRQKVKSSDENVRQEAELILNELWKKSVEGLKSEDFKGIGEYVEKRPLKEIINVQFRKKKKGE